MTILINVVWHKAVVDLGCVSPSFKGLKYVCVVVYGPSEGDVEERERFWNTLDRVADRLSIGYILCILGI